MDDPEAEPLTLSKLESDKNQDLLINNSLSHNGTKFSIVAEYMHVHMHSG